MCTYLAIGGEGNAVDAAGVAVFEYRLCLERLRVPDTNHRLLADFARGNQSLVWVYCHAEDVVGMTEEEGLALCVGGLDNGHTGHKEGKLARGRVEEVVATLVPAKAIDPLQAKLGNGERAVGHELLNGRLLRGNADVALSPLCSSNAPRREDPGCGCALWGRRAWGCCILEGLAPEGV